MTKVAWTRKIDYRNINEDNAEVLQLAGTGNGTSRNFAGPDVPAEFSGDLTGSVRDEFNPAIEGTIVVSDTDSAETMVAISGVTSPGGHGVFTMDTAGNWTYVLNEGNAFVNALGNGETMVDTFEVSSVDGTTTEITITIEGINDIVGSIGDDRKSTRILGTDAEEVIQALQGDDEISGLGGDDFLVGGKGADKLTGGGDADSFVFFDDDSGLKTKARDVIMDFKRAQGDAIDLSEIDAILATPEDDAFRLMGSEAKALKKAGTMWIEVTAKNERTLWFNNDDDKKFDFAIDIHTKDKLSADDFIL